MQQHVRKLETILFWPLSLHATGALYKARANDKQPPSKWLRTYAEYMTSQTPWERSEDPLREGLDDPDADGAQSKFAGKFAEFVYFHPFVQKILYPGKGPGQAMEVLHRQDIVALQLELPNVQDPVEFTVRRMQMFLFTTDLAVIAVHLSFPLEIPFQRACDLLNTVRRTYPPYFDDAKPGDEATHGQSPLRAAWKFKDNTESTKSDYGDWKGLTKSAFAAKSPPVVAHWAALVKKLEPWNPVHQASLSVTDRKQLPSQLYYEQLGDERAHSMVYLVLDDPSLLPEEQHYRLAFLDAGGQGWEYAPEFLRPQAPIIFYDRFWHLKTRYMVTGYSFAVLTNSGALPYMFQHFQNHYFMLNLLAVMQKNSLLIFWDRLTNLLTDFSANSGRNARDNYHNKQRWLSQDFSYYLARFDFSEVSNQLQALELFGMIRRNMHLDDLKAEVLQQLEYARQIENGNYEEGLTKRADQWIPVSLALGFLGLTIGMESYGHWLRDFHLANACQAMRERWLESVLVLVNVGLVYAAFRAWVKWPWKWAQQNRNVKE